MQSSAALPSRHCNGTERYTTAFMTHAHYTPQFETVKKIFERSMIRYRASSLSRDAAARTT